MNEQLFIEIGFGIKQAQQAAAVLESLMEDIAEKASQAMKLGIDTGDLKSTLTDIQGSISSVVGTQSIDFQAQDTGIESIVNTLETAVAEAAKDAGKAIDDALKIDKVEVDAEAFSSAQNEAEKLLKSQKLALAQMVASGQKGSDAYNELLKATSNTKKETDKFKDALDEVSKDIGDIEKKQNPFGKLFQFNQITQAFGTVSAAVQGLSQPFIALDTATQQLKTLGDEAAAMAPNLREAAIQMSKDLPFAAAELQTSMFDALASGVKGGEEGLKSFADTAAKLAVGSGAELNEATGLLAANLNAYGKGAEDAGKFSDIFFNTINFGVTSAAELSSTLANVIPTAAAAGVELEGVGAALAVMTSKGVPTAQSTTKLNALLIEIQKPGAELAKVLKAAGVSMESLKQDDLPETLRKIQVGLAATGKTATTAFSSSEAGAAFNVLAGDLAAFQETFEGVRDTTGSAQFAYEQMADSIDVQTNQMMATVNAFIIEGLDVMGSGFTSVINIAGQLGPTVSTLAGLGQLLPEGAFKSFGDTVKGVFFDIAEDGTKSFKGLGGSLSSVLGTLQGGFAKTFTGLSSTISGLGGGIKNVLLKALTSIIPGLFAVNAATGAATISFTAMWTAATGGAALVIAGIVALGAALAYFFTSTETGKKVFQDIADFASDAWDAIVTTVKAAFAVIGSYIGGYVDAVGKLFSGDVVGAVESFFGGIVGAADAAADSITESKLQNALDGLADTVEATVEINAKINTADSIPKLTDQLQKIQGDIGELELKVKSGTASEQDVAQLDSLKKKAAEVSDQIRTIAPAAEEGARQVTTSTGEILTVYDIGIEKAKELGKAQKDAFTADLGKNQKQFTEDLNDSISAYSQQKSRLDELTQKLNEAKKAGDADAVADLKEQIGEFSEKVKTSRDEINKALTEGNKNGLLIPADIRVPDNAVNEFQTQLDVAAEEAKRRVREKQLGEAVTPVVEIETKLKKNEAIPQLIEQFKNAKTEVEKQNLAKIIQEQAPDAVQAIGTVLNEEGKYVDVLEVNTDAALASAEANKQRYSDDLNKARAKFMDGIKNEGKLFQSNRAEAARLKAELEKAPKGGDTTALQKQYAAIAKEVGAAAVQAAKFAAQSIKAGGDAEAAYEQVAASLGVSKEEATRLVQEQERLSKEAENTAKQVRNLAAEYSAAKQAAATLQSEGEAAAATLAGDLRKINSKNAQEAAETIKAVLAAAAPEQIAAATALVEKSGKAFRDQSQKDAAVAAQITQTLIGEQVEKQKEGYKNQLQLQKDFNRTSEAFKREQNQKDIDNDLKAAQSSLKQELIEEERKLRQKGATTIAAQTQIEVDVLKLKQKYNELDLREQIKAAKRRRDFLAGNGGAGQEVRAADQAVADLNRQLENSSKDTAEAVAKVLRDARAKLTAEEERRVKEELQRQIKTKEREAAAILGKDSESLKKRFELEKELLDLRESLAVESAQDNVKDVALIYEEFERDRKELAEKSERGIASAIEDERIAAIADSAERRRQYELKVASDTYDADLEAAGKNERLKTEAFEKYISERIAIQKRFEEAQGITLQSAASDALKSLRTAFSNFSVSVDSDGAKQAKDDIAAIREEQRKLYEEQARGSKTYQQVADEQDELNKRMAASMEALGAAQSNFWKNFSEAAIAALEEVNKKFADEAQKQIDVFFATDDTIADLLEERGKLEEDLAKAVTEDNAVAQDEIREKIKQTNDEIRESESDKQDALTQAYAATAASATTSFLQMTLAGENAGAALVKSALDGLQSLVPILTAEIFGQAFAQLGPIGGAIAFAAVNAAFQGLIATAKSSIGFEAGGYTGDVGKKEVAGVVHGGEFVHTADKTARYRDLFEHIHAGGDPADYIFKQHRTLLRREIERVTAMDVAPNFRMFVNEQGRLIREQMERDVTLRIAETQAYVDRHAATVERMARTAERSTVVQDRVGALIDRGQALDRAGVGADATRLTHIEQQIGRLVELAKQNNQITEYHTRRVAGAIRDQRLSTTVRGDQLTVAQKEAARKRRGAS